MVKILMERNPPPLGERVAAVSIEWKTPLKRVEIPMGRNPPLGRRKVAVVSAE